MSSNTPDTGELAGFWTAYGQLDSRLPPLVFLHGSSHDERSLMNFASQVAPAYPRYFPRGREPWETAFTFFRRRANRSIDETNLTERAEEASNLLEAIKQRHGRPAVVIGFSSGAIMAAALLARHPASTAGAILLRPESPFGDASFPDLGGMPVLIVSGRDDQRRKSSDAKHLFTQLKTSGATAEWHDLPCGHDLDPDGGDTELTRAWLARRGS